MLLYLKNDHESLSLYNSKKKKHMSFQEPFSMAQTVEESPTPGLGRSGLNRSCSWLNINWREREGMKHNETPKVDKTEKAHGTWCSWKMFGLTSRLPELQGFHLVLRETAQIQSWTHIHLAVPVWKIVVKGHQREMVGHNFADDISKFLPVLAPPRTKPGRLELKTTQSTAASSSALRFFSLRFNSLTGSVLRRRCHRRCHARTPNISTEVAPNCKRFFTPTDRCSGKF